MSLFDDVLAGVNKPADPAPDPAASGEATAAQPDPAPAGGAATGKKKFHVFHDDFGKQFGERKKA